MESKRHVRNTLSREGERAPRSSGTSRSLQLAAILSSAAAGWGVDAAAQQKPPAHRDVFDRSVDSLDISALPGVDAAPAYEMSAILEVTVFRIDVITVTVRVGPESAEKIRSMIEDSRYSEEIADSVAEVILESDNAWARQLFHRGASFERLMAEMRENAERAADSGMISDEYFEEFSRSLPIWFGFLKDTGVGAGDEIIFRIRDDTLRTLFRAADGRILLDQTTQDPEGLRASIPSFFAPGNVFRKSLVESLFD